MSEMELLRIKENQSSKTKSLLNELPNANHAILESQKQCKIETGPGKTLSTSEAELRTTEPLKPDHTEQPST
ncbi:hypothetical protein ACTXT7_004559 [Hymenolepis weldensis]